MKKLFTLLLGVVTATVAVHAQSIGTQVGKPLSINGHDFSFMNHDKAPGDTVTIYPPMTDTSCNGALVTYDVFGTYSNGQLTVTQVAQRFELAGTAQVLAVGGYIQLIGSGDADPYVITVNGGTTTPGAVMGTGTLALDTVVSAADNLHYAIWTFPQTMVENQFFIAGTVTPVVPGDTIRYVMNNCEGANSFLSSGGAWVNATVGGVDNNTTFEVVAIEQMSTASVEESIIAGAGLMPNPAADFSVLTYSVTENAAVNVKVLNVAGQVVQQINEGTKQPGTYATVLDVKQLPAGTYFYQVTANGYVSAGRLVVAK